MSGRWSYCSGIMHSDYLFAGTVLDTGATQQSGQPVLRVVAIPTGELEILDTWHTNGLRGTGSHDAVAEDVFVPLRRTLSLFDRLTVDAPLYRFPIFGFFALSIAAAALGNARGAIDDLVQLAAGKIGQDSRRTLAERPTTQAAVAVAEASLRAARAFYYQAIDDAWQAAHRLEPVSVGLRTALRLAATHAVRTAAEIARSMYDLGGGSAIYEDLAAAAPLPRRVCRYGPLPGQPRQLGADRPPAARSAHPDGDAVSAELEVALPFWLDRPDVTAEHLASVRRDARRRA